MGKEMKLADDFILHLTKLIQMSMLTGVDIVDFLRTVKLEENDSGSLELTEEYLQSFEEYVENLLSKADEVKTETKELKELN